MKLCTHALLLAPLVAAAASCGLKAGDVQKVDDNAPPADERVGDDCNSKQLMELLEEVGTNTADPFEHGKTAKATAEARYGGNYEAVCSRDDFAYHFAFKERFCKWQCVNRNICLLKLAAESAPDDGGVEEEAVDKECLSARLKEIINEAGAAKSDPFTMGKTAQEKAAGEYGADYEAVCSHADFTYHILFSKRMCKTVADNGYYCLLKQN